RLSIIAAVALPVFVWIELTVKNPVINLRLLARRNFGLGTAANFMLGAALYGSSLVLPRYLSQIQGYNDEQIGDGLGWCAHPHRTMLQALRPLIRRVDP